MVERRAGGSAILTIPNLLSLSRILLIPVFVVLIVRRGSEVEGLVLFALVASTDWVDGFLARRTGQVSELGKMLDPVADRLVVAAVLVAVVVREAFPLWAASLILVRDALVLVAGVAALLSRGVRIKVRWIGKVATFSLMIAVPAISWGYLELPLAAATLSIGWIAFAFGIAESYVAAALYASDLRRALRAGPERAELP